MAQALRFTFLGIGDATQRRGHHIAVLKCGNKLRTLRRIMAEPVQQFRKAPFRRVHPAAPLNGFQSFAVGRFSDLSRFPFRSMIAPQIVFAERLQVFSNRNHRGARGIQGNGFDLLA